MSDTDDTDVLLLIPPDFFAVPSDCGDLLEDESYYGHDGFDCIVVNDLKRQLNDLKDRIDQIENYTDSSLYDYAMSRNVDFSKGSPKKFQTSTPNSDRYSPKRTYRSPKHRFRHKNSDGDSSTNTTPDKPKVEKYDKNSMLGEIDEFMANIKTIKRLSVQKNLNSVWNNDKDNGDHNRFNLKDVDRLLRDIQKQEQKMTTNSGEPGTNRIKTWKCGDNENTVPKLNLDPPESYSNSSIKSNINEVDSRSISLSNSEIAGRDTVIENIKKSESDTLQANSDYLPYGSDQTDEQHVKINADKKRIALPKDLLHLQPTNIYRTNGTNSNVNLFSLTDLWNGQDTIETRQLKENDYKVPQKLEEERMRRQHCEKMIQDLQVRILEMQQRLAVAVQVDVAKDEAILRFHEAWEKVAERWHNLESERDDLSRKLASIRVKTDTEIAEATHKVSHYEAEVSKALDLAHSNQEKCLALENEKASLLKDFMSIRTELELARKDLLNLQNDKDEFVKKFAQIERESLQDKRLLLEAQNEIVRNQKDMEKFSIEIDKLKEEKVNLEAQTKELKNSCAQSEINNKNLQVSLENSKKMEKVLNQEIKNLQEFMEQSKNELRHFYQQQVETLVREKLKEFQIQLEQAERTMQEELKSREQSIARTAAKQMQKLSEKHTLEVQLIEEKHKEEKRLFELQITQLKQQVKLQQTKMEELQVRRNNIAQELRNVMENQLMEALRIINSGRSLPASATQSENHIDSGRGMSGGTVVEPEKPSPIHTHRSKNENELQRYIRMLLDKVPSGVEQPADISQDSVVTEYNDTNWHAGLPKQETKSKHNLKDRSGKPPWK